MTPQPHFDPDAGTLRITRDTLAVLGALADPDIRDIPAAVERAHRPLLEAAGLLPGGQAHPVIADVLPVLTSPVCRIGVHRDAEQIEGWVGGAAAVFLLPGGEDELRDLVIAHPAFVPDVTARLLGLGPRPRPAVPARLSMGLQELEALLRAGPEVTDERIRSVLDQDRPAPDDVVATLRTAITRPHHRWRVAAQWQTAPDRLGQRTLDVLDTAEGLWLIDRDAHNASLTPVTPTQVWRLLAALLPDDEDLAPSPSHAG